MSQDTLNYQELVSDILTSTGDEGGDLQRHVIIPAMLDTIGPVEGKDILDLSCGAGYLSRRLAAAGGRVTAIDSSERLIGIAREVDMRDGHGIKYAVADTTDLSVIDDSSFDDIICNMGMMTVRDIAGTIAELARMVRMGGRFIFSTIHPCFGMPDACWVKDDDGKTLYKAVDNYFTEGWWPSELMAAVRSDSKKIKHRTLSRYVNALAARGFNVRRIVEPRPSLEDTTMRPHLEIFGRVPAIMIIEAVFPYF